MSQIDRAIQQMQSDDDDVATSGVEAAVRSGAPAVPQLVAALLSDSNGYTERNYYLCKALGQIGGDEAARGVLQHLLQASRRDHYATLLNFFSDPDVVAVKQALAADDEAAALARARARLDA